MSQSPELPLTTRLWFAWTCLIGVLFDAAFAARVWGLRNAQVEALPPGHLPSPEPARVEAPTPQVDEAKLSEQGALHVLGLLQREGRLIDFLEQDITSFDDNDVGSAARVVHDGCRKALRSHVTLEPVRTESEESAIVLGEGSALSEIKLTGNVTGTAPYRGVLKHRGWRVTKMNLPTSTRGHDAHVIAPAEVEL